MAHIDAIGQCAAGPSEASNPAQRQRLQKFNQAQRQKPEQMVHDSAEANLAHAVIEIFGAAQNFNFYPHEVNRQIAAVNLGKAHRVFLGSNNGGGLALLAPVDRVQDLLLSEAVVIGKAFSIDQFRSLPHQALFKAFRLGDATQGGYFAPFDQSQAALFASENIFKVERMMN